VGTGYNRDSTVNALKDFWEYSPTTNQWKQLSDFAGAGRYAAVGFSDDKYGYIGTGHGGNYYADFWQYDPTLDRWKETSGLTGSPREGAVTMTVDDNVFVCGGDADGKYVKDLWVFDPANQTWTDVTPQASSGSYYSNFQIAVGRSDAVAFSLNGKGYIATGQAGSFQRSIYQFDPNPAPLRHLFSWMKMTDYEGASRSAAVAFVVGGKAYVGTGGAGNVDYSDMEEFVPN
jgi:N-acetylneuraminic acid mutarotase